MNRIPLTLVCLLLLSILACGCGPSSNANKPEWDAPDWGKPADDPKEQAALNGVWILEELENGLGKHKVDDEGKPFDTKWEFKDGKVTITTRKGSESDVVLLDTSKTPKRMEIRGQYSPAVRGVYERNGDTLRVCQTAMLTIKEPFPTEIKVKTGSAPEWNILTLKKQP